MPDKTPTDTGPDAMPDPTANPTASSPSPRGFKRFRRTRPFWGSLILLWSSWLIGSSALSKHLDFTIFAAFGNQTLPPVLISFTLAAAALIAMFMPSQRTFPGIVSVALAIAALPLANLGGLVIGTVAGITGGALIVAWTPYTEEQLAKMAEKDARKRARKEARKSSRGPARSGATA
ncbi:DUF6114 domain-containing protein [Nocardioides sp. NBC_00368]|uniref:DUF6114 domain-containing protein n=1 Tax=Nocardioides sp. NBC_00368 TaxID=2976000 RepID=UPI002E1DC7ED